MQTMPPLTDYVEFQGGGYEEFWGRMLFPNQHNTFIINKMIFIISAPCFSVPSIH
jgi:hypothetical protein